MYAINALLFLGAGALAFFTFLFLAGAPIRLLGLATERLRSPEATWLRAAAVALGVLTAGVVAVTVADDAAALLHAVTTSTARGVAATPASVAMTSDAQPLIEHYPAPNSGDSLGLPASTPRECSASQGVVSDCTFN